MKHTIYIITILTIFFSCTQSPKSIGFKNPQPIKGKTWTKIPDILSGNFKTLDSTIILFDLEQNHYLSTLDTGKMRLFLNQVLVINKDSINNRLKGYFEILKADLDSSERKEMCYNYIDSVILQFIPNPTYTYQIDSTDLSFRVNVDISSNLFLTGKDCQIKEYRNKYYFNSYNEISKVWNCYQMDYDKSESTLKINTLTENDYEVLKRLIKLENDTITIGNELNPSIRTFNKFLKMNGFENKIKMVRE